MRAAVLAALAVCAAEGTTVSHSRSCPGSVTGYYTSSQEWIISCTPSFSVFVQPELTTSVGVFFLSNSTTHTNAIYPGRAFSALCPHDRHIRLTFEPHSSHARYVNVSWTESIGALPPGGATLHHMPDNATVHRWYSSPQEWVIDCTPTHNITLNILSSTAGYQISEGGTHYTGLRNQLRCPASGKLFLLYRAYDRRSHGVFMTWHPTWSAWTPPTHATSVPIEVRPKWGYVSGWYSRPQEWAISCSPHDVVLLNVTSPQSLGGSLLADGITVYSHVGRRPVCPYSGRVLVKFLPHDGDSHLVRFSWSPAGATTPTPSRWLVPSTSAPVSVHHYGNSGSVYSHYYTPQEWVISCTPYRMMQVVVHTSPSGYTLRALGGSHANTLYYGGVSVPCPSSGRITLSYMPHDGHSHLVRMNWAPLPSTTPVPYPRVPPRATRTPHTWTPPYRYTHSPPYTWSPPYRYTSVPFPSYTYAPRESVVHTVGPSGSIDTYVDGPQVWYIPCKYGEVVFQRDEGSAPLHLKDYGRLDNTYAYRGAYCPSAGSMTLSYTPDAGAPGFVRVHWMPASEYDKSQSISPLLIALVATAGVLVLVGVTVAVYCGCRGQPADPKAYSSNVQCEEFGDVVHMGGFGLQETVQGPSDGPYPVELPPSEMVEQPEQPDAGSPGSL